MLFYINYLYLMILKAFIILLLAFLTYIGLNFYFILGINKPIPLLSNNECTRFGINSKGPEDITYFNDDYLITASSNMVEIWYHFGDQANINSGDIILIPSNGKDDLIFLSKENIPSNYKLHAHGIYVKGNLLYILNHGYKFGGERADIFLIDITNKKAIYQKSFIFPNELYGITNDLIAINDDDFFVTSWSQFIHDNTGPNKIKHLIGIFIQGALRIKMTYVYHCSFSSGTCTKIKNTAGIMNNGITWNHNESNPVVYVVETMKKVKEYKIIKVDNQYQFILTKSFDTVH